MLKSRYSAVESIKIMGNSSKQLLGPNIEVLLWNVYKCQKKGWQKDFTKLSENKDLVLLQEAILNSHFDEQFKNSLKHQWIMARSFKHLKSNIETGVKTGSTVAAKTHYFSVSKHSEPISKTKKMLLATRYPLIIPDQFLLVVNCHLINFVSFKKFSHHLDQVFNSINGHTGPIVLAGDFNTWNSKRLKYFNQLAAVFKLEAVEMVRQPRVRHLFQHLDHIYCRGLAVRDAHVHTNILSSDHFPISLTLRTINADSHQV